MGFISKHMTKVRTYPPTAKVGSFVESASLALESYRMTQIITYPDWR